MTQSLREGLTARAPEVQLDGIVEIDEVYVTAGHKGNPVATQKKAGRGGGGGFKAGAAAARWRRKNHPSLG